MKIGYWEGQLNRTACVRTGDIFLSFHLTFCSIPFCIFKTLKTTVPAPILRRISDTWEVLFMKLNNTNNLTGNVLNSHYRTELTYKLLISCKAICQFNWLLLNNKFFCFVFAKLTFIYSCCKLKFLLEPWKIPTMQ